MLDGEPAVEAEGGIHPLAGRLLHRIRGEENITYLSLGRRVVKVGECFRVLGENKVLLGYRLTWEEFIIILGAIKKIGDKLIII